MRTALALALLALACGVHGEGHSSQCQDGAKIEAGTGWNYVNCPAKTMEAFTPSMCKGEATVPPWYNTSTAAKVDDEFVKALSEHGDSTYDAAGASLFYGGYCDADADGEYQVKSGVDTAWACAFFYNKVYGKFDCKKDWDCSARDPMPACESISAMMTAVCKLTAVEIKTKVDKRKTDGYCKSKADGGMEFAATTATTPKTTPAPTPSATSGSSPMWALALVACLFSAVPAV